MVDSTDRTYTDAEQRRLVVFEKLRRHLEAQGYATHELTVDIVKANIFALLAGLLLCYPEVVGFVVLNDMSQVSEGFGLGLFVAWLACFVVLAVVHELIHGATWAIFAENHVRDIEFGFIREYATPYCTCKTPLREGPYILGALMPLIVLGAGLSIAAMVTGSLLLIALGTSMTIAAGGDIYVVMKILMHKTTSRDLLYLDHPTQVGCVLFER